MKPLYFLLFLLGLTLGCDKQFDYEYAVVCEFPPSFAENNWLIVTAEDGTVLKEIEVAEGASSVSEKFTLSQQEPNELLNLHLVAQQDDPNNFRYVSIVSHYGIKNGQPVRLNYRPDFLPKRPAQKEIKVTIKDLAPFDQVEFPGCSYNQIQNSPHQVFAVSLSNGQGMAIRFQYSWTSYKWLYVPSEGLSDSIVVSAFQFSPFYDLKNILVSPPPTSGGWITTSVTAVSPDAQNHVILDLFESVPNSKQTFALPYGIPPDWGYHVFFSDHIHFMEKIFPHSDTIRLEKLSINIVSKTSVPGESFSVKCTGPVDWLEATSHMSTTGSSATWRVMGSSSAFENLQLPSALKAYLPEYAKAEIFKKYFLEAFHSPEYGYDGMAAGFPWKSSDPFTAGRQGYEMVRQ